MQAIRLHPSTGNPPFSPANPAPSSALKLDTNIPIPQPSKPGELLVRIRASAVIRDELAWPETYEKEYKIPGHDFAGTVVSTFGDQESFKCGDEVFGMVHADRGETWADYAIVKTDEAALKPESMSWEEAASLPLSLLTAYQALFTKGGLPVPSSSGSYNLKEENAKRVLITGASGGVGIYLVQLARLAGLHVTALTSSPERSGKFLASLGADEVVPTSDLGNGGVSYDAVIDTVGGAVLEKSWSLVKHGGALVSVDSSSYNFIEEHRKMSISRDNVNPVWFIVEPSGPDLQKLTEVIKNNLLRAFVAKTFPLKDASIAYEVGNGRFAEVGKIVLVI